MTKHFTHLHVHTEYSLLDGAINLEELVNHAKQQNLKALAITDHGNIFGAVKFFQLCKKAGIKPILGMEAYITENVESKTVDNKYYHTILLVQNETGYKNLCKLISFSYQQGFYFKPRIDYEQLEKYSEGLIVTSACLGGNLNRLLQSDQKDKAIELIEWHLRIFGKDRYYLEIQPEDQDEQRIYNEQLYELSAITGAPLVAATDCHYLTLDDHEAHEIMLALQTGKKWDDPTRFTFGDCRAYMRSEAEMLEIFKGREQAVYNTGVIADMCNFEFVTDKLFFPAFKIPDNKTDVQYFQELCLQGLEKLIANKRINAEKKEMYLERLHLEMKLIINMGFVGYFLIVSDFIMWTRAQDIPVGPGRGSAAGALVAWCLEITNIDPLEYNLLFERFLNPERVSMPDIDIDFCIEGRETVINHIKDQYGHDKVCQIITFGTMMAKGVIKDVARVLGMSFEDSNMITSLIPEQLKITLHEALELEPRLQELVNSNPAIKHLFDVAFRLEGITRHASKHAAGIVITPLPVEEMLPVYIPPKTNELVAQYAMTELESIGFLKIDLLGLKNLTLIKKAVNLIKKNHGVHLNIDLLPLDDKKTYELVQAGKTSGVFQLESSGLKDVLRKLKPSNFEDIIAVTALYRPGPLGSGMVDDFILRKHGKQKIEYLFPELEPVLAETYGVIVYQEQVMKIASTIAGYSLGESDILRRAMGKKKADVMAEQKILFVQKAKERSFKVDRAEKLFDLMAYFAGYGFNKSHSAAYAMIAFQTAYLKANYPAEFAASLISLESTNAEKMSFYLKEAHDMGLAILPPNVNESIIDFNVVNGQILFGLQGIKNIGHVSLDNIIAQREKDGPFKDLLDFCMRIDLRTSNKRVLENLICAGAFDTLPGTRTQKFNELSQVIDHAIERKKRKETGQMSMFSMDTDNDLHEFYQYQPTKEWTEKEKLEKEKEVLGFYISSHPLSNYSNPIAWLNTQEILDIQQKYQNSPPGQTEPIVMICGLLTSKKIITTKKGDRMAFLQVDDLQSSAEIIVFPRLFAKIEPFLNDHSIFIIKGALDTMSTATCKILANEVCPIDLFFEKWPNVENVTLILPADFDIATVKSIKEKLTQGKTPIQIIFKEHDKVMILKSSKKFALSLDLLNEFAIDHGIKVKISC
ncbi:DNA polymerase III subunit alpha [Candidatus Chromulinivorax destructor]|uniref:DNA-directed DNA polymerase n=1 Tax=Candidatus Chromulinivorax destructor TaxID=2066483 RepID=A0A345ZAK8_9BACT|nr:DNA polymerase III subunit alpha [Candidatus Chromulinivorax destructor]AXK60325.1 DNA polymerase III subunit alpha [Candidatus Chromulinivorax destructor]